MREIICRIVGKTSLASCDCRKWINKMNAWGPDGCREHIEEIVDRLMQQAEKHNWKLRVPGIGSLARLAPEGVQRWSCRQLVLLAIRRAEKAQRPDATTLPASQ